MTIKKAALGAFLLCSIGLVRADQIGKTDKSYSFTSFFGRSELVLGSEDLRRGYGFALGYERPERQFRFRTIPAQLTTSLYYLRTKGDSKDNRFERYSDAAGVLFGARYRWPMKNDVGFFMDMGLGIQVTNFLSVDINSHVNTTPYMGIGLAFRTDGIEALLGLQFMHISNGGTKPPNQGQNQIMLSLGLRF